MLLTEWELFELTGRYFAQGQAQLEQGSFWCIDKEPKISTCSFTNSVISYQVISIIIKKIHGDSFLIMPSGLCK